MNNDEILGLTISTSGFDDITVSEFFVKLLSKVWVEEESFSGKRPFGNSGWEYDLVASIGEAGGFPMVNEGTDEDPDWVLEDEDAAMDTISELLKNLALVQKSA